MRAGSPSILSGAIAGPSKASAVAPRLRQGEGNSKRTKAAHEDLAILSSAPQKSPHHNRIVTENRDDKIDREYYHQFNGYQKSLFLK